MNKKLSKKDLKVWKDFIEGNEKLYNKDNNHKVSKYKKKESTIDLHGFSLDQANSKIEKFITNCFEKKIEKLNIITGKGLRSKVEQNPYQSKDLGILKYSIPEFVRNNEDLMKIISNISEASVKDGGTGAFYIFLKKR